MQTEVLWKALEADASASGEGQGGWLLRLALPTAGCPLFVGLELASSRRAILLRLPSGMLPVRRKWPRAKGLEPLAVNVDGNTHFGVALKEPRFADVFTALAEDLVRRVGEIADPAEQARVFLGQLARWQKFLSASLDGLSEETQRGLWGELHFLREQLLPVIGTSAVAAWKGGERAHQDFQFEVGAVEVKTTLAKQPQVVRITSERQLDDAAWTVLFLAVIALDVRDGSGIGETLPAIVASLRSGLSTEAAAQEQFEDALIASGYFDIHAPRYAERGYLVRSQKLFRISRGFPRLIESDMPNGIGDANYGLSVAACERFSATFAELNKSLNRPSTSTKKSKGKSNE